MSDVRFRYLLRLADTSLVLGQRLGEWVGHAPALEEDLGLANLSLDLIGQARLLLTYAGELEGKGRDEDQLAFLRDGTDFFNVTLAEGPEAGWFDAAERAALPLSSLVGKVLAATARASPGGSRTTDVPKWAYTLPPRPGMRILRPLRSAVDAIFLRNQPIICGPVDAEGRGTRLKGAYVSSHSLMPSPK